MSVDTGDPDRSVRRRQRRRRAARLSRRVNRFVAPVLVRLPGFGVLEHAGRRSGERYQTPLRLIGSAEVDDRYIVLTYGTGADWYQNLRQAPGTFRSGQRRYVVSNPRLVAADRANIWRVLRALLRLANIEHLVQLTVRPDER